MKALIVDDEKNVRDCIKRLANWSICNVNEVFEAESVAEAIAIVKVQHPAIVFTDIRMPQADGIELMRYLHDYDPQIQVVIISGYSEFDYAVNAIRYGATDYILKPVQQEKLDHALESIARKLSCMPIDAEVEHPTALTANERVLLALIAEGDLDLPPNSHLLQLFRKPCGLMVLDLVLAPAVFTPTLSYRKDFPRSLRRKLETVFQHNSQVCIVQGNQNTNVTFILLLGSPEDQRRNARAIDEYMYSILGDSICSARVFESVTSPETLYHTFTKLLRSLREQSLLQDFQPSALERPQILFDCFSLTHPDLALSLEQSWDQNMIQASNITLQSIHAFMEDLCAACHTMNRERPLTLTMSILSTPLLIPALSEHNTLIPTLLNKWTMDLQMMLLSDLQPHQSDPKNLVRAIGAYIDIHYAEGISLQSIASLFDRNASYIARKFQQHFQTSVMQYIANKRVDRAKRLLESTELKVFEISDIVGYSDEKYFFRVFKKTAGCSPLEYRLQFSEKKYTAPDEQAID